MTARAAIRLLTAAALAAATAGCGHENPRSSLGSPVPAPPTLSAEQINEQDQVSAAHRRRESLAMDSRPLLDHLPIAVDGVAVSVGGLAADNATTVLLIDPGERSDRAALAIYRALLRHHHDTGHAYRTEIQR